MSSIPLSATELAGLDQLDDELPASDSSVFYKQSSDDASSPSAAAPAASRRRMLPMAHKFETLTNEANNVCSNQEAFDGVRLEFHRHLGSVLTLTHALSGSMDRPGTNMEGQSADYSLIGQFNAPLSYVGKVFRSMWRDGVRKADGCIALEEAPGARSQNRAQVLYRWSTRGDWLSRMLLNYRGHAVKLTGRGRGKQSHLAGVYELTGADFHTSLSLCSQTGLLASYTQRVIGHYPDGQKEPPRELYLGCELNYSPSQAASSLSFAGRLRSRDDIFTLFASDCPSPLSRAGLAGLAHFTYARRAARAGTWATRLLLLRDANTDAYGFSAIAAVGFDYHLPQGGMKAYIDSSGRATATAEISLNPLMSLACCVDASFPQNDYKAGLALQLHL